MDLRFQLFSIQHTSFSSWFYTVYAVLLADCDDSDIFNTLASPLTSKFHVPQFHAMVLQGLSVLIHMQGLCSSQKQWRMIPWPLSSCIVSFSKAKTTRYNTIKFHCPLGRKSAVLNNMCNNVLGAEKFLNTLSAAVMDLKIGLSPQALLFLFYCRSCSFSMAPFPLSLSPQVLTVALNLFSFSHQTVHAVFHFGMLALVFINNQAAVSLSGSFEISSTKK